MTKAAEQLLAQAMALGVDDRIELAELLLESSEPSTDPEYVKAWETEIRRRLEEWDRGEVTGIPWEQARKMIVGP